MFLCLIIIDLRIDYVQISSLRRFPSMTCRQLHVAHMVFCALSLTYLFLLFI